MAQQRKSFGRIEPTISLSPVAGGAAPDGTAKAVDYDWLTQPLREGVAASSATERDLGQQLVHLVTASPYRRWIWIMLSIAGFTFVQFGLFGGGIVMPERSGHDYVAGNQPREAAQIVDFAVDGGGFHEDSNLMAENLEISGTLVNGTDETIWQVTVEIIVRDCFGGAEFEDCPIAFQGVLPLGVDVPPGGQVSFDESVPTSKLPLLRGDAYASYAMLAVSTK